MKRITLSVLLACVLVPFVMGCMHTRYQNQTKSPISFTSNLGTDRHHKIIRRVDDDYRRFWLVFYLIPVGKDGSDMIAQSSAGAEGMANLKIKSQFDIIDVLVTNLTFGLFCTRRVNVQGDLVEFEEPVTKQQSASEQGVDTSKIVPVADDGPFNCPSCGKLNERGAKFCPFCGAKSEPPAPIFCFKCGLKNKASAKFCIGCGAEIRSE